MALKKSRKITVRDQDFHWKFKAHKDQLTRYGASPRFAHIAVQAGGKPMVAYIESTVFLSYERHDGDTGDITHKARFGPGDVKRLIEHCLDLGWDPSAKKQFNCPAELTLADHKTYEHVPNR
jgi:hypothetical protein